MCQWNFSGESWNLTSGELLATITLNSPNANGQASATTPDGNRLALVIGDQIEVFETRIGHCLTHFISPMYPGSLDFSADGQLLVISGDNYNGDTIGHRHRSPRADVGRPYTQGRLNQVLSGSKNSRHYELGQQRVPVGCCDGQATGSSYRP